MGNEDKRTTYTLPADLLDLLSELRQRRLLPRGLGLHKDNAAVVWLAIEHARLLLQQHGKDTAS